MSDKQEGQTPQQPQIEQLKEQAEQKIEQAIDQFAARIPGGTQFSPQAKDAAEGILDNLQKQAERAVANPADTLNALGGVFGGLKKDKEQQEQTTVFENVFKCMQL